MYLFIQIITNLRLQFGENCQSDIRVCYLYNVRVAMLRAGGHHLDLLHEGSLRKEGEYAHDSILLANSLRYFNM